MYSVTEKKEQIVHSSFDSPLKYTTELKVLESAATLNLQLSAAGYD